MKERKAKNTHRCFCSPAVVVPLLLLAEGEEGAEECGCLASVPAAVATRKGGGIGGERGKERERERERGREEEEEEAGLFSFVVSTKRSRKRNSFPHFLFFAIENPLDCFLSFISFPRFPAPQFRSSSRRRM